VGILNNIRQFLDAVAKEQANQELEKAEEMHKLIEEVKSLTKEATDKLKRKD
jgi:hypothetical protein